MLITTVAITTNDDNDDDDDDDCDDSWHVKLHTAGDVEGHIVQDEKGSQYCITSLLHLI